MMPIFLLGCLFSLVWSSAFIAGKISLAYASPLNFLSFRFLSAGVLLLVMWGLVGRRLGLPPLGHRALWLNGSVLGLLNYALYLGFSYTGLQTISPQLVILIVAATPFVTSLLSACLGARLNRLQMTAIAIGFGGVYLALADKLDDAAFGVGVLWVVAGVLALAGGTLFYRRHAADLPPLPLIGIQNLIGGLLLLPYVQTAPLYAGMLAWPFMVSWLYQVVMVSIVAMWMWFWLVRRIGPDSASVFHLMNPIFGILLSAAFFETAMTVNDVAGTVIVIAAMALAAGARKRTD